MWLLPCKVIVWAKLPGEACEPISQTLPTTCSRYTFGVCSVYGHYNACVVLDSSIPTTNPHTLRPKVCGLLCHLTFLYFWSDFVFFKGLAYLFQLREILILQHTVIFFFFFRPQFGSNFVATV